MDLEGLAISYYGLVCDSLILLLEEGAKCWPISTTILSHVSMHSKAKLYQLTDSVKIEIRLLLGL